MKPFVLVDVDTKELILVIKNVVKRISIDKLENASDFLDEFYRRFKEVNFASKYNVIDRKQFMDLVDGFQKAKEESKVKINRPAPSRRNTEDAEVTEETNDELANSTLIRSGSERKIFIEDLNMRFDDPFDYFDLSMYDQEKVKKSAALKFFLDRGIIVKTTMNEIAHIRKTTLAAKEKEKRDRQEAVIIERHKDGEDDDVIMISDEQYRAADANMTMNTSNVPLPTDGAAKMVFDTFSQNVAIDEGRGRSMDDLLRNT